MNNASFGFHVSRAQGQIAAPIMSRTVTLDERITERLAEPLTRAVRRELCAIYLRLAKMGQRRDVQRQAAAGDQFAGALLYFLATAVLLTDTARWNAVRQFMAQHTSEIFGVE